LLNLQRAAGDLLDAQQHAVAVELAQRHGFENEQIEGAWEQAGVFGQAALLCGLGEE
jgi:hypothetical protein